MRPPAFVTAITEPASRTLYPGAFLASRMRTSHSGRSVERTGEVMSLGTMAAVGFVAAVILIVVTITLINKYAH
jgi:hypothetical protein